MRLNRSQNAIRNSAFGILNKIVTILFPFIVRTVFINILGAEYLGLNSLFSSILSVLSLTELGFSSAIVFSMYKPIAQDDTDTINALLCFYKRVYRVVGTVICVFGLLLVPFLPELINGTYPEDINLIAVYLVYLFNTVISYFMYAYLSALISAFQREDLLSRINIFISIGMYLLQLLCLLVVKNYYVYLLVMPVFTVVNNLRTAYVAKKYFPDYTPKGTLPAEVKSNIKEKVSGLFVSKICSVTRNSFDSIFISMFIGLTETAIYNNYYFIMTSIVSVMSIFTNSITAGVGNSVSMDSVEKNYADMRKMNFLYMWLSGWCTICLFCLYQPFMKIWVGEELMFPFPAVVLICAYFYTLKLGDIRTVYVQAAGLWWENRYRAVAEAAANLALNYLLGKYFGVYGIIVATLISLFFINYCYGSQLIFRYYFKEQKISRYFLEHTFYFVVTCICCFFTYSVCASMKDGIFWFMIRITVCVIVPNIIYFLVYSRLKIFKEAVPWILSKFRFLKNSDAFDGH
ncbi:MAG: oligosaccharide flippase family protein [Lachnospiraceae bacterium]|nr:oligosaccharide flippase family protein [Lachnospiraceae bacterium]